MGFSLLERATGVLRGLTGSRAMLNQEENEEIPTAQREELIRNATGEIARFHQLPYGMFEDTAREVFAKHDPNVPLIRLVRLRERRILEPLGSIERTDALKLGYLQAGEYWLDKIGETETLDPDMRAYIQRRLSYVGKAIPH